AHVKVAREPGRDQVLAAVLHPLHRLADQQRRRRRDHVAGIDRHLVAEAAADVGRDDPDVLLGQPGDDREQRGWACGACEVMYSVAWPVAELMSATMPQ